MDTGNKRRGSIALTAAVALAGALFVGMTAFFAGTRHEANRLAEESPLRRAADTAMRERQCESMDEVYTLILAQWDKSLAARPHYRLHGEGEVRVPEGTAYMLAVGERIRFHAENGDVLDAEVTASPSE